MGNTKTDPPDDNELEISVFGPGYGEAAVVHLGNGQWILVDSCLDDTKKPAGLAYLESLGVDPAQAVKFIVVTHWHGDHVHGVATTLKRCAAARLVLSDALHTKDFERLEVSFAEMGDVTRAVADEMERVGKILKSRRKRGKSGTVPTYAKSNCVLHRSVITIDKSAIEIKICALSPSDKCVDKAKQSFRRWLPVVGKMPEVVSIPTQNDTSVVLWIQVGDHKLLLGADLESGGDQFTGWTPIVYDSKVLEGTAAFFKVPHHGSSNGHHAGMWEKLLDPYPCAVVTPFSRKSLPTPADVERLISLTPNIFMTSRPRSVEHQAGTGSTENFDHGIVKSSRPIRRGWGQVRFRSPIVSAGDDRLDVELFGDAHRLGN